MQASFAVFVKMQVSLGCHFGTYVQHLICYHSGTQATANGYVVALCSGALKCSMANVNSGISNSHQRVMQQVQTGLLASNKSLSVCTVTWYISICFNSHNRALMRTPSCFMLPVLGSLHMMHILYDDASQSLGHPAQFANSNTICVCVWHAIQYIVLSCCWRHVSFVQTAFLSIE